MLLVFPVHASAAAVLELSEGAAGVVSGGTSDGAFATQDGVCAGVGATGLTTTGSGVGAGAGVGAGVGAGAPGP